RAGVGALGGAGGRPRAARGPCSGRRPPPTPAGAARPRRSPPGPAGPAGPAAARPRRHGDGSSSPSRAPLPVDDSLKLSRRAGPRQLFAGAGRHLRKVARLSEAAARSRLGEAGPLPPPAPPPPPPPRPAS